MDFQGKKCSDSLLLDKKNWMGVIYGPNPSWRVFFAGVTGILLFIVMTIIFVFAHPTIRKKAYKFFWSTHSLYILLYALCLIHGAERLTGAPSFWIFFIGPAIIYTLDKVRCTIIKAWRTDAKYFFGLRLSGLE